MGRQQLAVCFAPLLLAPALSVAANEPAAYELRRQIDTLRWLLDLWPLPSASGLREPLALFVSAVQYMSSEYTHTHTTHTHTHTHRAQHNCITRMHTAHVRACAVGFRLPSGAARSFPRRKVHRAHSAHVYSASAPAISDAAELHASS